MTNKELVSETDQLVEDERNLLARILRNFREIERRRAYVDHDYPSLFKMVTQRYGYSEDQAYARINAMHLIKDLPSVEEKIKAGHLNITHLVQAQRLFNKEAMSKDQKLEVFEQIAGKTTRESERITLSLATEPAALKPDRVRAVTEELSEVKFVVDQQTLAKLETFKGLVAHTHPNATLAELLNAALDLAIEKKKSEAPRKRRAIFERANYRCENCGSQHALEIDHIIPKAKGGSDDAENLRVLCRPCNQHAAINEFGQTKMDLYF